MKEDKSCDTDRGVRTGLYKLPKRSTSGLVVAEIQKVNNRDSYKGKVLVMDDQEVIRMLLSVMLLAFGYEAHLISNGEDAIASYRKAKGSGNPFDAVIIDLNIPGGMDGKETIRKLLEIDPDVKAIVSIGFTDDPAMINYRNYGFKGALQRPYTINELRQVLQDVICSAMDDVSGSITQAEN